MPEHRHGWSTIDFFVKDDRPMLRQRCTCGQERALPAWDRSWVPPEPTGTSEPPDR